MMRIAEKRKQRKEEEEDDGGDVGDEVGIKVAMRET